MNHPTLMTEDMIQILYTDLLTQKFPYKIIGTEPLPALMSVKPALLAENEQGILTLASYGIEDQLGYSPQDLIGTYSIDLAPENAHEDREKLFDRVKSTWEVVAVKTDRFHKERHLVTIDAFVFPFDRSSPKIAAVIQDAAQQTHY